MLSLRHAIGGDRGTVVTTWQEGGELSIDQYCLHIRHFVLSLPAAGPDTVVPVHFLNPEGVAYGTAMFQRYNLAWCSRNFERECENVLNYRTFNGSTAATEL